MTEKTFTLEITVGLSNLHAVDTVLKETFCPLLGMTIKERRQIPIRGIMEFGEVILFYSIAVAGQITAGEIQRQLNRLFSEKEDIKNVVKDIDVSDSSEPESEKDSRS